MNSGDAKDAFRMFGPVMLISIAQGLQVFGAFLLLKAPIDFVLMSTIILITFSIYFFNKFTDKEDSYNCPDQKYYFQRKNSLKFIPIALLGLSFLILILSNRLMVWHIVIVTSGIFYSVNIIPLLKNRSIRFVRFKDILLFKNILVCLLWGITPFALALGRGYAVLLPANDFVVILIGSCLSALINTTSSDIPDTQGDRRSGVLTIANCFGKKGTAIFLGTLATVMCLAVGGLFYSGNVGVLPALFFFVVVAGSAIFAAPLYIDSIKLPRSVSMPINDTQAIYNGVLFIVFSLFL